MFIRRSPPAPVSSVEEKISATDSTLRRSARRDVDCRLAAHVAHIVREEEGLIPHGELVRGLDGDAVSQGAQR